MTQSKTKAPRTIESRRHPRRRVRLRIGKVANVDDKVLCECAIRDVSKGGARLVISETVSIPDLIALYDDLDGTILPAAVCWRNGHEIGVSFELDKETLKRFRSPRLNKVARRQETGGKDRDETQDQDA